MIPVYNPPPDYLAETLRSILRQDPGEAEMQIEVWDDCSPDGAPVELVKKIAGDRVKVHRVEKNLGLAGIWNHCISRARGKWIHLLHQDDVVLPGFYERFRVAAESPAAPGLIYCRHNFIDELGREMWQSEVDTEKSGLLRAALPHLARAQMIQTPSVVVRRSVYEALGGFRSDLCFSLDWEMWCRIAKNFPVWFEPELLASYRIHSSATTSRMRISGEDIVDLIKCIRINTDYIADEKTRGDVREFAKRRYAMMAVENAERLIAARKPAAARRQIRGAWQCDNSFPVFKQIVRLLPSLFLETIKTGSR